MPETEERPGEDSYAWLACDKNVQSISDSDVLPLCPSGSSIEYQKATSEITIRNSAIIAAGLLTVLAFISSIHNCGTPEATVANLIIEAHIQAIRLLYITTKNLFPQTNIESYKARKHQRNNDIETIRAECCTYFSGSRKIIYHHEQCKISPNKADLNDDNPCLPRSATYSISSDGYHPYGQTYRSSNSSIGSTGRIL